MLTVFNRIVIFFNLVFNYGVNPSTILKEEGPLKRSSLHKSSKDEYKHGM